MKLPYIRRYDFGNEGQLSGYKYIVGVDGSGQCDACKTISAAICLWLWHMGVPPKIAFFLNKLTRR